MNLEAIGRLVEADRVPRDLYQSEEIFALEQRTSSPTPGATQATRFCRDKRRLARSADEV